MLMPCRTRRSLPTHLQLGRSMPRKSAMIVGRLATVAASGAAVVAARR